MTWGILLLQAAGEGGGASAELAPTGYGLALLKMLGALVLVCVLAYVALRLLRNQLTSRGRGGLLRVVERCPLTARQSLWVVEVGERVFLIGTTEGSVTKLAELDHGQLPAPDRPARRSFREILLGRGGSGSAQGREATGGAREDGAGSEDEEQPEVEVALEDVREGAEQPEDEVALEDVREGAEDRKPEDGA